MTTDQQTPTATELRGMELEYTALRSEILKRIELRQQVISVTLTLAGAFLGVGLTKESVVLIYPLLAALLALGWAQNDFRIKISARYIRDKLESHLPGLNYETSLQEERKAKSGGLGSWRFITISHGGIILITQLAAIVIEFLVHWAKFRSLTWTLLSVDVIAVIIVIWLLTKMGR
jgi:hypothetical protein